MANRYSEQSQRRLDSCHEDLQLIFTVVLAVIDNSIICGHRGEEEQRALFAQGPSVTKVNWPDSRHNSLPSMAVDAAPYDRHLRDIDWKDKERFYFFAGMVIAVAKMLKERGLITHDVR